MTERIPRRQGFSELVHNLNGIRNSICLISSELERRKSVDASSEVLLATDFDIIHEFLYLGHLGRYERGVGHGVGFAAMQVLKDSPDFRFTLLPGAVYELISFCSNLADALPRERHVDGLLSLINRELATIDLNELDIDQTRRQRLLTLISQLDQKVVIATQLSSFISSSNLTGLLESGIPEQKLVPAPDLGFWVHEQLSRRRPLRSRNNTPDSLNLSIVLTAATNGVLIPLITKTSVVQQVYRLSKRKIMKPWTPVDLVITPDQAFFTIQLGGADSWELEILLGELVAVELSAEKLFAKIGDTSESSHVSRSLIERAQEETLHAREMVDAYRDLTRTVPDVWRMPELRVPNELDLPGLAAHGLAIAARVEKQITSATSMLADQFDVWASVTKKASQGFASWQPLLPMLELLGESSLGSPVFIDKLIIVGYQEGAVNLNTLSISGGTYGLLNVGDLHHIKQIDTQVTTLADFGDLEVAKAIKALAEAVAGNKEIADLQRHEILDQLNELSQQAATVRTGQARAGVVRALLMGLATSLSAAGGLAEVWSTWGPVIEDFFAKMLAGA